MNTQTLKTIRKAKKIKIATLAGEIGVTPALMGRFERGLSDPKVSQAEKWADLLDCQIVIALKP
jgi:transcriptional regulator with XRE-family HTH domain